MDKLICAPADYIGLEDLSDDYDVSAKLLNVKPHLKGKVSAFIAKNPRRKGCYFPQTSYNKYGDQGGQG